MNELYKIRKINKFFKYTPTHDVFLKTLKNVIRFLITEKSFSYSFLKKNLKTCL